MRITCNKNVTNLWYLEAFIIVSGNKIEVRFALGDYHVVRLRDLGTLADIYICDGGDDRNAAVPGFYVLKLRLLVLNGIDLDSRSPKYRWR